MELPLGGFRRAAGLLHGTIHPRKNGLAKVTEHIGRGGRDVLVTLPEGVTRKVFFQSGGSRHRCKIPFLQKVVNRRAQGRATAQGGEAIWRWLRWIGRRGLLSGRLGRLALGVLLAGELGEGGHAPDDRVDRRSFDIIEIGCLLIFENQILLGWLGGAIVLNDALRVWQPGYVCQALDVAIASPRSLGLLFPIRKGGKILGAENPIER